MKDNLSTEELQRFERVLRGLQRTLAEDFDLLKAEALSEGDSRSERQGDADVWSQEFNLDLLQMDENTLVDVTDAIGRLAEGTFGRCEQCDRAIQRERLEVLPHARLCLSCEVEKERSKPNPE